MVLAHAAAIVSIVDVMFTIYFLISQYTRRQYSWGAPDHILLPLICGLDITVAILYLSAGEILNGVVWVAIAIMSYLMINNRWGGGGSMKDSTNGILPKWVKG